MIDAPGVQVRDCTHKLRKYDFDLGVLKLSILDELGQVHGRNVVQDDVDLLNEGETHTFF